MAKGGYREGSGRKPKADEARVRDLAIQSIIKAYGSEEEGFLALLKSGEPGLVKFVYEHAYGKPKERVEHSGDPDSPVYFKLDERFLDDNGA